MGRGGACGGWGALMNNLVHIPTTPAAQRERKKGMKRGGREMDRWRKREMDRGGEDKSQRGESEG